MPIPLDEFPVHQAPLSMAYPVSSDRNAYDRCYLNAHDRTGDVFAIAGLGIYPNLGVTDAYIGVRSGDRQVVLRASDALGDDRLTQEVGPFRLEMTEPLHALRLVVEGADHGVEADLRWQGSFPAVDESPHHHRQGPKAILDAQRFAQVGTWEGHLRVDDQEWELSHDQWVGTRDRSWGIRPVGEPEPPGRTAAEMPADFGFWWIYVPMRFDDFAVLFIAQEDGAGFRTLNDAVRVWPDGRIEQLGWPRYTVHYTPGTREAVGATITAVAADGSPMRFEVESRGHIVLNSGLGYGDGSGVDPRVVARAGLGRARRRSTTRRRRPPGIATFGTSTTSGAAVLDGPGGSRASGCSSTCASAPTPPAASPTSAPSPEEGSAPSGGGPGAARARRGA